MSRRRNTLKSDRVVVHRITYQQLRRALWDLERVRLRALRERRGWTQATLAEVAGYSYMTVRSWESGYKIPKPASLADWREALAA